MKVFWPTKGFTAQDGLLLGWEVGNDIVVVGARGEASPSAARRRPEDRDEGTGLKVVGRARLCPEGTASEPADTDLIIWLDASGHPCSSSRPVELILFAPPDPSRLRFFKSGGQRARSYSAVGCGISVHDGYSRCQRPDAVVAMDTITPLLNEVYSAQAALRAGRAVNPPESVFERPQSQAEDEPTEPHGYAWMQVARSHSAAANQLSLRMELLLTLPKRFRSTRPNPLVPVCTRSENYISFWNTVWLILNDLILGYCARQCLLLVTPLILGQAPVILSASLPSTCSDLCLMGQEYLVRLPSAVLSWLDDWPMGLKLNTPLSAFFATSYRLLLSIWETSLLPLVVHHLPTILAVVSFVPLGGLTLLLATAQDALSLLTLHLRLCHILGSSLCRWQLSSLSGLWNLFRGKQWNVLRQRTDSYAYDVDQLFLGTLLFTVSIFLLPTVAIYAALFAVIRVAVTSADELLDITVTALNAFPLFELMLRLKEPSRLPAAITIDLGPVRKQAGRSYVVEGACDITHVLRVRNAPKTIADILRS